MKRVYTFETGETSCHLGIKSANPYVITAGAPGRIRKAIPYLERNPDIIEWPYRGTVTVHGFYKGVPVTLFSSQMGASSVSLTFPEIIEACDERAMRVVRIGTAGSLQPNLQIGDLVVSDKVEIREGVSAKVAGHTFRKPLRNQAGANHYVLAAIGQVIDSNRAPFQSVYTGKVQVTDEAYLNTKKLATGKQRSSALAVSMELSALTAWAHLYNKEHGRDIIVGEVLTISDHVVKPSNHLPVEEAARRREESEHALIRIGLEALVKLKERDDSTSLD